MNSFLADVVGFVNGLLGFLIIAFGAVLGYSAAEGVGLLLGALAGLIAAVLVCGALAILIDIRNKLVQISTRVNERSP